MIVLNGVVGLCLLAGGKRYHEQAFQLHGAAAALAVLSTLATLTLVLPNYTLTIRGPYYSSAQLIVVGAVSLILYGVFIFVQTVRHRDYFLVDPSLDAVDHGLRPSGRMALASALFLIVCLTGVIFLAKSLSSPMTEAVVGLGLPLSLVGVAIAGIVLLPEAMASLRAAWANQIQNSLNLALGSALASIGLTIPTLGVMSLLTGKELSLGLGPIQQVLLVLTLFTSILTLGTGRTTVLQGAVHLAIFCVFLLLEVVP
jgi:Ca2+:H+ antiporter